MCCDVELANTDHRPREVFCLNCRQVVKLLVDFAEAFGEIYRVLAVDVISPIVPLKTQPRTQSGAHAVVWVGETG